MAGALTISELQRAYRAGTATPTSVVQDVLARVAAYSDPAVWIARVPEADVMERAAQLTTNRSARSLPLYGIPFAVKDNIDVVGVATTAACPAFAYRPERSATVVEKLLAAGAILIGKTNLDQFATGLAGTRSPYGAPRCVFNADYISGGSSSGSAVAVAADLVPFSLGTDTAGSGRVPAAFNNLVGLKPTRGQVSTFGVVPACRSLDCVSIFTRNVPDAQMVLDVVQGFDEKDPYSRASEDYSFPEAGFRFGILSDEDRQFFGEHENEALYDEAIARLKVLGGEAVQIDYALFRAAAELLYQGPWVAERLAAIQDFFSSHAAEMDPTVRGIIAGAERFSAADAFAGQYRLTELRRATDKQWSGMDVFLLPTAPAQYTVEAINADPITLNARLGTYTNFVNLLDCCAVAIPAGFRRDGLAFGVTLIAPAFYDISLSNLAARMHKE
jgi:allophanate hydrolase